MRIRGVSGLRRKLSQRGLEVKEKSGKTDFMQGKYFLNMIAIISLQNQTWPMIGEIHIQSSEGRFSNTPESKQTKSE